MFSYENFFSLSSLICIVALTQAQQQIWKLKTPQKLLQTPHLDQYQPQQLQAPYFTQFNVQQHQPFSSQQIDPSLHNFQQQYLQTLQEHQMLFNNVLQEQQLTPLNSETDNLRLLPGVGVVSGQHQQPIFKQISSISSIPQQQYNSPHLQQDFLSNVNQQLPPANIENPDGATITQQEFSYKSVHYSSNSPISQGQYSIPLEQQQVLNNILQQLTANNGVSSNDGTLRTSQLLTPIVQNIRTASTLPHKQGQQEQLLHNILQQPQQQQHFKSGSQSSNNLPNNGVLEKKTSQLHLISYHSETSDDPPTVQRPQTSCNSCCDPNNSLCRTCCGFGGAPGLGLACLKGATG